jgi:inosine-uridine nucleoside N-ribohydrolase
MKPVPVVLDCDTANEVDDQFAIAHALGVDALDVRGVISVHDTFAGGPGSRDRYQEEAERVVGLCGRSGDVPCVPGAARPMEHPDEVVGSPGLRFLAGAVRAEPGLVVIATGPATDVAALTLAEPELARDARVVWLGGFGSADEWALRKYVELNGRADVAAWRALFASDVPLVQVPGWTATTKLEVDVGETAARLRAGGSAVGAYLADIAEAWDDAHGGNLEARGRKVLWDVACVAAVADPGSVTLERRPLARLDAAAAHDFTRPVRETDVLADLDPARVLDAMFTAIARHPGPTPAPS